MDRIDLPYLLDVDLDILPDKKVGLESRRRREEEGGREMMVRQGESRINPPDQMKEW